MTAAHPLEVHKGTYRLLLLFAPSAEDARYLEQVRSLQGCRDALEERDVRVFHLLERGQGAGNGAEVGPETAQRLRTTFSVAGGDFVVVLIGKDGTEKARYQKPVDPPDLFATIDRMPMRQQEVRERGREGGTK
jgi:hypothetical protein